MAWDDVPTIEITCGRHGVFGIRNKNLVPIGGLIKLRNATFEDRTWRTGGGADLFGTAIGAGVSCLAATDYWPDINTQRTLIAGSNGQVYKDNGLGTSWTSLVTLPSSGNIVPGFAIGGQEESGKDKKAFYFDRINSVRVLSANGATMTVLANPPADWAGANQPAIIAPHQGYMWGGGNMNAPHILYRTKRVDHEDYANSSSPGVTFIIAVGPTGNEQRIVNLLSFKGGLLCWKFPEGLYFIDTRDATPANWFALRIGTAGGAGPGCAAVVGTDVLYVAPDGSWHSVTATQTTGLVRADDITVKKLGPSWLADAIYGERLPWAQMVYDERALEVCLAHASVGSGKNDRRLHMDLSALEQGGENWIEWDRDVSEALFMRQVNKVLRPAIADDAGQVWNIARQNRDKNGAAYEFEWWMADTDFGEVAPQFKGKKKNLRWLKVEHDSRSDATHTIEVWRDGVFRQTLTLSLTAPAPVFPFTFPLTFNPPVHRLAPVRGAKRLQGQATRIALRGKTTTAADVSLTRLLIGMELAE